MKTITALVIPGMLIAIFACYAFTANQNNKLSAKERAEGWKLLFDGSSTSGWHLYNSGASFTVWKAGNGELFCDPKSNSDAGDLVTDGMYKNYDLKFDWKLPKGGNSGVFINVAERADIGTGWQSGPEYQLLDKANADYAKPEMRSGSLFGIDAQKTFVKSRPADTWNHSEIIQKDGKVQFYLNGILTVEEDFTSPAWAEKVAKSHFKAYPDYGKHISGHIVLQDWATGVSFRNIKIKEL